MSTRAQVRFATREDGVSFSEHPEKIHAQFYVHSDGYPEGLGLEIAESLNCGKINNWEIEDLCAKHSDLEYIYYIWQCSDKHPAYISIFDVGLDEWCSDSKKYIEKDECIFVGKPNKLIEKYKIQEYSCVNFKKDCDCFSGPINIDEGDYEACIGYEYKVNTNDDG
jgi:hypothetical protein